jgi:ribonucleoside-diphosphate reductase beta chain
MINKYGLTTRSASYRPLRYPWALEYCKQQHRVHWLPEEVPLAEDIRNWSSDLSDQERALLSMIFKFFTQSDVEVNDNYLERYARIFAPTEVKMMLAAFASMETVHILGYALLVETIGMPDETFADFTNYQAMADKVDYMRSFGVENEADVARTLAMFGGATEGLSLFGQFAMLMSFPLRNRMKGMGQIVSWSVRDESLHCDGIIRLYHQWCKETSVLTQSVKDDICDVFREQMRLEHAFVDLAFSGGDVPGMTPEEIKAYLHFVGDWRLRQLRLPPLFGDVRENPLPWLQQLLSGVEHANFFEARATEYSKAASRGSWGGEDGVWASFDAMLAERDAA